ncbi:MAG: ComEC/Rec2 family competence protein [Bacteroidaceae bacterium]|nr:ComEC/Rec2 family competence protein [Bacteroidaceae bacterium]
MPSSYVSLGSSRWQLFPLLRVALFLLAGMLLGEALWQQVSFVAWLSVFGVALLAALLCRRWPVAQSVCMLLAILLAGSMLMVQAEKHLQADYVDAPVAYQGVVLTEPVQRGKVVQFDMMMVSGVYRGHKVKASLLRDTVQQRYLRLHRGDGLEATSIVEPPRQVWPSRMDWPRYLHVHGYVGTTFIYYRNWQKASVSTEELSAVARVRLRMLQWRDGLLRRCEASGLDTQAFGMLTAMTLGHKGDLDTAVREVYQATGVSHLLALSGMHLGIIYMLLTFLLPRRRFEVLRQLLLLSAIWAYVLLVGMPSSVVRAATMISVYAFTHLLQRRSQPLNTLALAAILLMVANPLCIYDVGFQLSFTAVLFILLFFQPVYGLLPERWLRWRLLRWLWSMVVMSVVAQVGTAPLVMHHFGTFAVYFLPANLIAVPLATLLIGGTLLLMLLTPLPAAQHVVAAALSAVVNAQNQALGTIAAWPGATINDIQLSTMQTWLLYTMIGLVAGVVIILNRSRIRRSSAVVDDRFDKNI